MKKTKFILTINVLFVLTVLLNSCAKNISPDSKLEKVTSKFVNPYPAGTYENFKAEPSYPKTYNIYKNTELLESTNDSNSKLVLDLGTQRGKLMNGDTVVMDYPISSGRSSHPTPKGSFSVLEKIVDKKSGKYGRILDANGDVINSDADSTEDSVPAGGKFAGAPMKYWMRFTWDGVGHHIGKVPRYPASHGCIRGYASAMPIVFSKVKVGSSVTIQ
jgi:L,D-transpeptidase catalytic domain